MLGLHIFELAARMTANPKNGRFAVRCDQNARNSPSHSLAFALLRGGAAKSGASSRGVARPRETFEKFIMLGSPGSERSIGLSA